MFDRQLATTPGFLLADITLALSFFFNCGIYANLVSLSKARRLFLFVVVLPLWPMKELTAAAFWFCWK